MRSSALRVARRGMAGGPDGKPNLRGHKKPVGGPINIGHSQYAARPCVRPHPSLPRCDSLATLL